MDEDLHQPVNPRCWVWSTKWSLLRFRSLRGRLATTGRAREIQVQCWMKTSWLHDSGFPKLMAFNIWMREIYIYIVNKDLRCKMLTWIYLDFIIYFQLFLQVNKDLKCRMVTWIYLDVLIYFELFLQANVHLRCRMVTCISLDVLIFFEMFLQVNMDLRCRMVTYISLDFIFYVFFWAVSASKYGPMAYDDYMIFTPVLN